MRNDGTVYYPEIKLKKGDVIIGKVITEGNKGGEEIKKDYSYVIKSGEEGVVDHVITSKTPGGYTLVKVVIRTERIPEIGDKFAARSAQKGTCLFGDSLVSLQSGNSIKIKDIKVGEKIWGLDENNGLKLSFCADKKYMGNKNVLDITLKTGDKIKCTEDHKIMTKRGWIEAKDIKNNDYIMYNLTMPLNIKYEDEKDWNLNMSYSNMKRGSKTERIYEYLNLNMSNDIERNRTLAFARILGFVLSDGWICGYKNRDNEYRGGVALGTKLDSELFINDIKILLNDLYLSNGKKVCFNTHVKYVDSKSYAGACFIYNFPAYLARCIASLEGMPTGKRILKEPSFPKFVYNAPLSIIREFLGGLFGGDGTAPFISRNEIHCIQFVWKTLESNLEKSNIHIEGIKNMLARLNVQSSVIVSRNRISKAKDEEKRFTYGLHLRRNSEFLDNIGFRYCMNKQCKLQVASTFWKMRSFINNKPQGFSSKPKQCMNTTEWLEEIDANYIFNKGSYCIGRYDESVPYFYIPVNNIIQNGKEDVYDITVPNLHSFIANGLVVHNCGIIMSQEDMPFTEEGIVPDIIINPHCLSSRMTIGQLLECVLSKCGAIDGEFSDATPFGENSTDIVNTVCERLGGLGYEKTGTEIMYNGFTGERLHSRVFIGPTHYQRLKHLVSDKMHARAGGKRTILHHQPLEGRSKDGGELTPQCCVKTVLVCTMYYIVQATSVNSGELPQTMEG